MKWKLRSLPGPQQFSKPGPLVTLPGPQAVFQAGAVGNASRPPQQKTIVFYILFFDLEGLDGFLRPGEVLFHTLFDLKGPADGFSLQGRLFVMPHAFWPQVASRWDRFRAPNSFPNRGRWERFRAPKQFSKPGPMRSLPGPQQFSKPGPLGTLPGPQAVFQAGAVGNASRPPNPQPFRHKRVRAPLFPHFVRPHAA